MICTGESDKASIGFLQKGERLVLADVSGVSHPLDESWKLRVAHPHDMMQIGVWSEFMHLLYRDKIAQPFKQVFREYYPVTEDELQERTISRRYAEHQVQPRKTVALLRSRGWTVDYEEGLQKVFYKQGGQYTNALKLIWPCRDVALMSVSLLREFFPS